METIRKLFIVEDHQLFREGLKAMLTMNDTITQRDMEVPKLIAEGYPKKNRQNAEHQPQNRRQTPQQHHEQA